MASQPTNDSISTEAAPPTEAQPCGANGVQCAALAAGADPTTATTTSTTSTATSANCTEVVGRTPPNVSTSTTVSNTAAATTPVSRPPPSSAATYPPPIRQTTGAPHTTPARKHQPTARPTLGPSPAAAYPATPPAPGNRVPSAVNTEASAPDTTSSPSQARMDAGPASAAASPGSSNRLGPSSAPT